MSTTIIGLDSFISGLGLAKEQSKPVVERAALTLALKVREIAQEKAPKKSSTLAQSIQATPIAYGAQTTVGEKYGVYVEDGTGMFDPRGAHVIYPTSSQVLAWESGGELFFAKWTRGMEAQPFWEPAVKAVEPEVETVMGAAADALIKMAVSV